MDAGENLENRILNFFAFFMESISLYVQSLARQNSHFMRKLMRDFQIEELFDAISDKFAEHPALKFLVFAVALSCAVPVVMFIAFGIISAVLTFTGFLFVEGTLLAVGGLCMFIYIITLILVLSMLGMMLGVSYVLASKIKDVVKKFETRSNILKKMTSSVAQEPGT